jgi:WXG100 family type VII secretion target
MFQANVDSMRQIARLYAEQLDQVWETVDELTRALEPLRESGWIGRGAEAFLNDMDNEIFAAFRKILRYLEHSQHVSEQTATVVETGIEHILSRCRIWGA